MQNKKYVFGGIIVVVFLAMMSYLFTQSNVSYESDFSKVMEKARTVKATGSWMKERNYEVDKEKKTFSFFMKDDKGTVMKVVYNGTIPNNFEVATSIVVTGVYKEGSFQAKDILTKCPSKYEDQQKAAQS